MSRPASEPPEDIDDPRRQDVVDPHIVLTPPTILVTATLVSHTCLSRKLTIPFAQQRAHIYSLCTALGGPSIQDPTKYELGDEALPVLKDLRQWLRLYDRALNRLDVARCLSEVELVQKDLLEIIAGWKEEQTVERRGRWRVVLACGKQPAGQFQHNSGNVWVY